MEKAGTIRRKALIRARPARVWRTIGDIGSMPRWAAGVKKTAIQPGRRRGVGAVRRITFDDGSVVVEHVVSWSPGRSLTYVATSGLPVRAYVATIAISAVRGGTSVEWGSYVCADMTRPRFEGLLADLGAFYSESLRGLASLLGPKV